MADLHHWRAQPQADPAAQPARGVGGHVLRDAGKAVQHDIVRPQQVGGIVIVCRRQLAKGGTMLRAQPSRQAGLQLRQAATPSTLCQQRRLQDIRQRLPIGRIAGQRSHV